MTERELKDIGENLRQMKISFQSVTDNSSIRCPRCKGLGIAENHDSLCDKCCQVILEEHPNHPSVIYIRRAYELQREKYYGLAEPAKIPVTIFTE
jgi:Ribonuclease G/E